MPNYRAVFCDPPWNTASTQTPVRRLKPHARAAARGDRRRRCVYARPVNSEPPAADISRPADAQLSSAVLAARAVADSASERVGPALDEHVAVVLQNCRIALDAVAKHHAHLADVTDLDLTGESRWTARWQLSGAAIAFAHALVDLSAAGHVDTALPTSRTLSETLAVVGAVNDDEEDTILQDWLAGEEVRPKKVRAAAERQAQRVKESAAAQGVDLDVGGLKEQMDAMYRLLSDASHVRRTGLQGLTSGPLRRAVYGRHPDPAQRAAGAVSTVLSVESAIIGVGDALTSFYGGPFYAQTIKPIQDGLMESSTQLFAATDRR